MIRIPSSAHRALVLAAGLTALSGPCLAASASQGPMAPIRQFISDFNKGDNAGAKATHVASPSIIDEVPPHAWNGPGAFDAWSGDLAKDATAHGDTGGKVTLGSTIKNQVDGDTAYVVIHATYSYDEKGQAMAEPASFTFALRHAAGGWKIASWAWNGTTPHAVKPKAATPTTAPATAPAATPAAKPKSGGKS
jgi:ketosteroid isomerase-like protein